MTSPVFTSSAANNVLSCHCACSRWRDRLSTALFIGQARLRTIERLNLAFLPSTQSTTALSGGLR